jgi:hypothetical protein
MALDAAEAQALKDLATLFVNQEIGPLLADLISKLPATYAPIVSVVEQAVLPAIQAALDAEIAKL